MPRRAAPTECRAREQRQLDTPVAGAEGDDQRSAGRQRATTRHQRQRQEARLTSFGAPKTALPQAGAASGEAHRLQPYTPEAAAPCIRAATLCDFNRQVGRARGGGGGGECLSRSCCELWRGRIGHVPAERGR
eukprot:scaffold28198_cov71-Phaeocystis_antarctica.AAC.7